MYSSFIVNSLAIKMATNGIKHSISNGNGFAEVPATKLRKIENGKNGTLLGSTPDSIDNFLKEVVELALMEGFKSQERDDPVVRFEKPDELSNKMDLELGDGGESHEKLLECCKDIFKYSVKTGHPRFFNQLYGGLDPYGFAGQVITDVLNTSIYTYEVAPVFILMEKVLLEHMMKIIGYEKGDGTFCPGGSYSNLMGMHLGRCRKFPDIKEKGLRRLPRMVLFTSEHGHYSVKKNAALMGLPTDDVIKVKCDDRGKMCPKSLEEQILMLKGEGAVPFFVNATAGTTVLGAYDRFEEIADICKKYQIWMHVDAAWGGSALMSEKYKHLCKGMHRADSITWNQHKMMMAPLQCSSLLTRHPEILRKCNSIHVPYLFQTDKTTYDTSYDIGTKIIQCGRKVDSLKLWMLWKAKGNTGIAKQVEKAFDNAEYLAREIKKRPGFRLVLSEPECTNVCFWYIPPRMRDGITTWTSEDGYKRDLSKVAPIIKERMVERGSMLIGYQPLGDKPNFFRMVVMNEKVEHNDMDFVLDEIERLGADL
ncbi:cysteine sulfinic acid decarboxylase-like [Styela clava]